MKHAHLIRTALATSLVLAVPFSANAAESPVSSALYYELGSGLVSSGALNPIGVTRFQTVPDTLPSVCDIWENRHNLKDVFGDLVDFYLKQQLDAEGLSEQIITGIKTAPQVLLVAALQRALPGFYDFSQNLKSQIDFKINNAELNCQRAVDKMDQGTNPLDGWIQVATGQAWRQTLTEDYIDTAGTDNHLLAVEASILENARSTPIEWFGGAKGTTDTTKIKFVNDVVSAGYAALADAATGGTRGSFDGTTAITAPAQVTFASLNGNATAATPALVDTRLSELWVNSSEAAEFAVNVLGEEEIAYCEETCTSNIKPGRGLSPEYEDEFAEIITAWALLISTHGGNATRPTIADFDDVSSRTVRITKEVFEAVIAREGVDRVVIVERLASDVAAEKTIDKALALRQLLRAGANTPQVRGLEIATDKSKKLHDDIRAEVDDLRWEIQQQNYGSGGTAASLLAAYAIEGLTRTDGSLGTAEPTEGSRREGDRVVPR